MTPEEYWAALAAIGLTRVRRLTAESILCRDRDGDLHSVEDPLLLTPEQRLATFAFYRRSIAPFDA